MKTKQLLLCLLITCLLLSGCGVASQNSIQDTTNAETNTAGIESMDNLTSDWGGGKIYNLPDFYTFATTGSRRAEDYIAKIPYVPTVESKALLRLETLFTDKDLLEAIVEISIPMENYYTYCLQNSIAITVIYDEEFRDNEWLEAYNKDEASHFTVEDGIELLRNGATVNSRVIYATEVDGIKVGINVKADEHRVIHIGYDHYRIDVFISETTLNAEVQDAKYAEITALFENGISTEAVQKLIQNIKNAIPKDLSESRQ